MPPHIVKLAQVRHLAWSWLFALPLLLFTQKAAATTCAGATTINPASLPINGQSLVCGAGNDLNSTNVPGNLCGSGNWYDYKDGNEALYQFTPTTTGKHGVPSRYTSAAPPTTTACTVRDPAAQRNKLRLPLTQAPSTSFGSIPGLHPPAPAPARFPSRWRWRRPTTTPARPPLSP